MAKKKSAGRSTQRPLSWPTLGAYVVPLNQRKNGRDAGTWRIVFKVPARIRPRDWPATIQLPRAKPFCNGPDDLEAIIRIREDAESLYRAMTAGRDAAPAASAPPRKGSIPWLIQQWGGDRLTRAVDGELATLEVALEPGNDGREEWRECEPRTRAFYIRTLRPIFTWSEVNGHIPARAMTPSEIRKFLDHWKDKPGQRKNIRGALSQLFSIALEEGELLRNPLEAVKVKKRKRVKGGRRVKVDRWSRADVKTYADTARTVKAWRAWKAERTLRAWPGGAIMIQLMYETAADSTDVITWTRQNVVTRSGVTGIDFNRGKTNVPAFIPISRALAAEIKGSGSLYLVTDPFGVPYEPVKDDARLRGHLVTLREKVTAGGGPYRVYDHLRHSAITEGVEGGIELTDMMHLSAHSDSDMNREVYVQRSADKAIEIQRARGLID